MPSPVWKPAVGSCPASGCSWRLRLPGPEWLSRRGFLSCVLCAPGSHARLLPTSPLPCARCLVITTSTLGARHVSPKFDFDLNPAWLCHSGCGHQLAASAAGLRSEMLLCVNVQRCDAACLLLRCLTSCCELAHLCTAAVPGFCHTCSWLVQFTPPKTHPFQLSALHGVLLTTVY